MNFKVRCAICNAVSDEDIETNVGDFSKKEFVADPKSNLHFICTPCKEAIEDLNLEYSYQDDIFGWKDDEIN